jgi:hypothetical protein
LALIVLSSAVNASPILVTPVSFDFGDVHTGATSPSQIVTVTNVSSTPLTPSFAGGGVSGADFGGFQNCAGKTLAPGESCQFTYFFEPQAKGAVSDATSISVDGETSQVQFKGNGISEDILGHPCSVLSCWRMPFLFAREHRGKCWNCRTSGPRLTFHT